MREGGGKIRDGELWEGRGRDERGGCGGGVYENDENEMK